MAGKRSILKIQHADGDAKDASSKSPSEERPVRPTHEHKVRWRSAGEAKTQLARRAHSMLHKSAARGDVAATVASDRAGTRPVKRTSSLLHRAPARDAATGASAAGSAADSTASPAAGSVAGSTTPPECAAPAATSLSQAAAPSTGPTDQQPPATPPPPAGQLELARQLEPATQAASAGQNAPQQQHCRVFAPFSPPVDTVGDTAAEKPPSLAHRLRHRRRCTACAGPAPAAEQWRAVRAELRLAEGDGPYPAQEESAAADGPDTSERALRAGYAWLPLDLPDGAAGEYMQQLPERQRPLLHSPGQRERSRRLLRQLPAQDLAAGCCRHLAAAHRTTFDEFATARRRLALEAATVARLDSATNCAGCGQPLAAGRLVVAARRFAGRAWHPACFTCAQCREPLADLVFCELTEQPLCARHHAERLQPRCAACDELVWDGEFVRALGLSWHREHLVCESCELPLSGRQFVLRQGAPSCLSCYSAVGTPTCRACRLPITLGVRELAYAGHHWHAMCFRCRTCGAPLEGRPFALRDGQAQCGGCGADSAAAACDQCGRAIAADEPQMAYKAHQWHQACFACCECRAPLGARTFLPQDGRLYCARCYEETFAARCHRCRGTITSVGVTYQGETWHRECFTCNQCDAPLAGQKFGSHQQRPYCSDCFTRLFAKRCDRCRGPICREPGTKYSVFRERSWHNACFTCAACATSLVGKGFIDADGELLCATADCARSRLAADAAN